MNIINRIKSGLAGMLLLGLLGSCNKLYTDATPIAVPSTPAGNTIAKVLAATPSDSLYYKLVLRSGILNSTPATITDSTQRFTMFVADNNAMKAFISALSGGLLPVSAPDANFVAFINANIPPATAAGIVSYGILPQALSTASFPSSFPNLQYPTIINPAPSLSSLLRLTTFPSKRGSIAWVNNVPLASVDVMATNGVIHHEAAIVVPPSTYLWDRISADPDMTYFKAAVLKADQGTAVPPSTVGTLQGALSNIGANLTVFVPTDSAMRAALTGQITLALMAQGLPQATAFATATTLAATPAVFTNPALAGTLTPTLVQGLVVYHILGTRAFTVNLPSTGAAVPTLLNTAIPTHPGVTVQATLTGPVASAASVKGAANTSASKILLDPTPGTGKSDQHALNGVIHKIDQVLLPQ